MEYSFGLHFAVHIEEFIDEKFKQIENGKAEEKAKSSADSGKESSTVNYDVLLQIGWVIWRICYKDFPIISWNLKRPLI